MSPTGRRLKNLRESAVQPLLDGVGAPHQVADGGFAAQGKMDAVEITRAGAREGERRFAQGLAGAWR